MLFLKNSIFHISYMIHSAIKWDALACVCFHPYNGMFINTEYKYYLFFYFLFLGIQAFVNVMLTSMLRSRFQKNINRSD